MKKLVMVLTLIAGPAAAALAEDGDGDAGKRIAKLREADLNHDGTITGDEFKHYRAALFDKLDRNKDGFLTAEERPNAGGGQGGGHMLERFDSNKDGKVDRNEFVNGPTPFFDKIDTNHDGALSSAELDAAIARSKEKNAQ
jgi:hypothetical protein